MEGLERDGREEKEMTQKDRLEYTEKTKTRSHDKVTQLRL